MNQFEVRDLSFSLNGVRILSNLNFSFSDTSMVFILGHNGSGKSTLLKIISLIYENYEGKVIIEDNDIKNIAKTKLADFIAFVPSELFCPYDFLVKDIIVMGRNPKKKLWEDYDKNDYHKVYEIMSELQIEYLKDRSINRISSGEKQLVFLAQALIQNPKILLLDEPTSHLDINYKLKIFDILIKAKKRGISSLIVSHEIRPVKFYSDYVLVLKNGEQIFYGLKEKINDKIISQAYNIKNDEELKKII